MIGDITCSESGNCRLDLEFGKMAQLPRDLIPLSKGKSSSDTTAHRRTVKKQIKRVTGSKNASTTAKSKPRGRPKNTAATKTVKRVANKSSKQVKPKPRGRPPKQR